MIMFSQDEVGKGKEIMHKNFRILMLDRRTGPRFGIPTDRCRALSSRHVNFLCRSPSRGHDDPLT